MIKPFQSFNIPTIKRAIALMGGRKKTFVAFILGFCAVELCGTVLYTIGIKGVINSITAMDITTFWLPMSFIIANHILWWTYAPISAYFTEKISKSTMRDFKATMCEHIVRLPMRYHDNKPTGELLSALSNDTDCLSGVYDWSFFQVLRSAIGGVGGIVVMAVIDWRFAIVVFTLGTISVYISSYFSKKLEAIGKEQQERLAKTSSDAYELVRAAKTIRLFHIESYKQNRFADSVKYEAEIKVKCGRIIAKMNSTITAVNTLSYVAILSVGALFVYLGLLDWGTVIALLSLKGICDMLFVECGQFMAGMQTNVAGIKRIFEVMDTSEEPSPEEILPEEHSKERYPVDESALVMKNVCFSYYNNTPVLHNFNLSIKRNSLTALVGESGSGKSTVLKLILGLYNLDGGNIYFDDSNGIYKDLREATAYVPQEPTLFRGTVYENIALGNPKATKEEILSAAIMAGADEFINTLKLDYDTVLLDNGASLSGGQKQRIAIARALLKNAPILLLDEITSALDHDTESVVISTIKNISKNKTILFITHKTNVVDWADEIILMK